MPTKILKGVLKVDITDRDDDSLLILPPIEATLFQPLEVRGILDFLPHQVLCNISLSSGDYLTIHGTCPS